MGSFFAKTAFRPSIESVLKVSVFSDKLSSSLSLFNFIFLSLITRFLMISFDLKLSNLALAPCLISDNCHTFTNTITTLS